MTLVTIRVMGMGTIEVKIGYSIYTYPLPDLLYFREKYFNMEQQK